MPSAIFVFRMFFAMFMLLEGALAYAQNYPDKPVRLLTGGVGGGNDIASRLLAPGLAEALGQRVIVDNRSNSVVPAQIVAEAPPDGYTLLFYNNGLWTLPLIQKAPYDPITSFAPVIWAVSAPNLLVVNPSVAAKSVQELIALAKAKPGELNYASSGAGASNHLAAELFNSMAGIKIVRINYKSGGAIYTDLISGQVQVYFGTAGSSSPHIKSGRIRVLAVTSIKPSVLLPGVPTIAASGLPGYESISIHGILAPARTPAAVIMKLNPEIARVLNRPEVKEKFFSNGVEVVGSSPEQFAATIKSEMARLGKVIKEAGIRDE